MRTSLLVGAALAALASCGDDTGPSADDRLSDAIVFVSDRDGYPQLYRVSLDGSRISYLPQDGTLSPLFPDVSPDGTAIVFYDQYSRVKVQSVDNADSVIVSPAGLLCAYPAWSPDGTRIAMDCRASPGSDVDLYIVNRDGSDFRPLVASPGDDQTPAWSPDGRRIAYASTRDGNFELYVRDLETGRDSNLTGTPEGDESMPAWSPDGRLIAFNSKSGLLEHRSLDLLDVESGSLRRLLDRLQDSYSVDWSADGRFLAIDRDHVPGGIHIAKVDVATGAITPITETGEASDRAPTIAPASGWQWAAGR
jgi:TolB protein